MGTVFLTRKMPASAEQLLRAAGHDVRMWEGEMPPPEHELLAGLREADGAITLLTDRISADVLAAAPRLTVAANMAVGYDNFDIAAADAAGVWLSNTPGVLAETTADYAFALLLAAARNVVGSERDTRAGGWRTWSPTGFLGPDVHGATLGIVGLGEIGQAVARRARGFAMRLLYTSRTRRPELEATLGVEWQPTLDALLPDCDFVSLHLPLTGETRRLMDASRFRTMKPGAILVNTSRGAVVDQEALVEALRSGRLGGAALDVTDPEPLPLDHALFGFPNVVVTPHIASASFATRSRMAEMAARNVVAALAGQRPPNAVNQPARPR